MKNPIYDLFDFNCDGQLDYVEEATAYITLFERPEEQTLFQNDVLFENASDEFDCEFDDAF